MDIPNTSSTDTSINTNQPLTPQKNSPQAIFMPLITLWLTVSSKKLQQKFKISPLYKKNYTTRIPSLP